MSYTTGLRLSTGAQVVQLVPPFNATGSASTDVYITTKNCHSVSFIIQTGAWVSSATAAVTLLQSKVVAGTSNAAVAFDTMYTNATNTSKSALVSTAVASNTFNLTTANATYIIDFDVSQLDVNNGYRDMTLHVATPGSNSCVYGVVAVLVGGGLRYAGNTPPDLFTE